MNRAPIHVSEKPTLAELRAKVAEIDRALRKMRFRKQEGDAELADFLIRTRDQLARQAADMEDAVG